MSRYTAIGANGAFRALMMVAAVVVVILPIIGLRLLSSDTETVSATGAVSLTPGRRMVYVVDEHVAAVPLQGTGVPSHGQPVISDLLCARIHASAGTGLCLRRVNAVSWSATLLDRDLAATTSWPLPGTPALARVSPSGRMVAWTSLTKGRSLSGSFTAVTSIVDTKTDTRIDDLDTFTARQAGRTLKKFQVWGVTFLDDGRFYATVAADGKRYLALGNIAERTLRTVAADVTSPALSPDGKRIAFVHRGAGESGRGRLAVMHLATRRITDLSDQRGVADQPVWLDGTTIAYVLRDAAGTPSIWATTTDPAMRPALLLDHAESPSGL